MLTPASRRCARRSPGAMTCCPQRSSESSERCPSSPVAAHWKPQKRFPTPTSTQCSPSSRRASSASQTAATGCWRQFASTPANAKAKMELEGLPAGTPAFTASPSTGIARTSTFGAPKASPGSTPKRTTCEQCSTMLPRKTATTRLLPSSNSRASGSRAVDTRKHTDGFVLFAPTGISPNTHAPWC